TFSVGRSPERTIHSALASWQGLSARTSTHASGCGLPRASSGSQFGPALCGNRRGVARSSWRRISMSAARVAVGTVELHLPDVGSLNANRHVLTGLHDRLRQPFHLSLSPVH